MYISSSIFDKNTHFLSNILDETCKNEKKIVIFVPNFKDSIMPAPDITFQNEKGKTIHLDKLKGKITLIDFWASWCGPCKMMGPVVEQIAEDMGDSARVCKINIDEQPELASQYNVMSIPTFILFKEGKEVNRTIGAMPKEELARLFEI